MITAIYIGKERLDLFDDENIVLSSSVAKIEDITKIFTDTSNTFTVPCNEVNNTIFKHWYNQDIFNGFDARKKVPCVIYYGGISYKVGKIRLNKVNLEHNQPYTYSLDFFGNLVDLKDTIGDDKLSDLDFSFHDFIFDFDTVLFKLSGINDVSFSLLSKRRFLYDSVNSITTTDKTTNIYYDGNNTNSGIRITDLSASIRQLKIIEVIETTYGLKFSRDFFSSYDFSNQFLALTGKGKLDEFQIPLNIEKKPDPTKSDNSLMVLGDLSFENQRTRYIFLELRPALGNENIVYSFYIKNNGKIVSQQENVKGIHTLTIKTTAVSGGFNTVDFWVKSEEKISFYAKIVRFGYSLTSLGTYESGLVTNNSLFKVSNKMPDIKVIDYIKGIFKMSKLIAEPQKDGTIYVENIQNYYRKGKILDFTDYIDYSSHTVSNGKIASEIKYQFEEPQTILNQQFKKNEGVGYGDLELEILDDNDVLVDGDKIEYKLPFEQVVYERITDISDSEAELNAQYGLLQDEDLNFVDLKPHIHYISRLNTGLSYINRYDTAIKILDGISAYRLSTVNVPSHILDFNIQTFSTTFGTEFNTFDFSVINNTLYSNYHSKYIQLIFSKTKREYNFKAVNVPSNLILNLKLNDVIQIKEKYYRIEEFKTNTTDKNIDFKLINDRIVDLNPIYPISVDSTIITADRTDISADSTIAKEVEPIIIEM